MGRWLLRIGGGATGVVVALSCSGSGVFECADASDCGSDGLCSAGYCAFPDAACPSGYSYGEYSPADLVGECVPGADGTDDGPTTTSSTSTGNGPTGSSSPPPPATSDETGDDTTGQVDPTVDTTGGTPWLDGEWPRRLPIVIDGSRVAGGLSDFVVLVSWSQNDALSAAAVTIEALRFAAFDEPLSYEIESFEPDTGGIVAWVRLPSLDAGVDTPFHLYYGGTEGAAVDGEPWADFGGVWHLSGDGVGTVLDASPNANDGVSLNEALEVEAGKIGSAVRFDGATDGITIDHAPSLDAGPGLTLSAWILGDAFAVDAGVVLAQATTFGNQAIDNSYYLRAYDAWLEVVVRGPEVEAAGWNGYGQPELGSWHHVVGVHDGEMIRLYFDGEEVSANPAEARFAVGEHPFRIGSWGGGMPADLASRTWDGLIDEARMTTVARTPDWIATEYSNQQAPEAFAVVGDAESAP